MSRPWRATELRALEAMWHHGMSDREVARVLGRTEQAVGDRRRAVGLVRTGRNLDSTAWSPEEDAAVRLLEERGLTWREIAQATGRRSPHAVRVRLNRLARAAPDPARDKLIEAMRHMQRAVRVALEVER